MRFLRFTKPNKIKPMSWSPESEKQYGKYTKLSLLFLLIVLLIIGLSGCSKAVSIVPMPLPPANLASNCPVLPAPPSLLTDPDRATWEVDLIAKYGDCALKHRLTVEAWEEAVKTSKK